MNIFFVELSERMKKRHKKERDGLYFGIRYPVYNIDVERIDDSEIQYRARFQEKVEKTDKKNLIKEQLDKDDEEYVESKKDKDLVHPVIVWFFIWDCINKQFRFVDSSIMNRSKKGKDLVKRIRHNRSNKKETKKGD